MLLTGQAALIRRGIWNVLNRWELDSGFGMREPSCYRERRGGVIPGALATEGLGEVMAASESSGTILEGTLDEEAIECCDGGLMSTVPLMSCLSSNM